MTEYVLKCYILMFSVNRSLLLAVLHVAVDNLGLKLSSAFFFSSPFLIDKTAVCFF